MTGSSSFGPTGFSKAEPVFVLRDADGSSVTAADARAKPGVETRPVDPCGDFDGDFDEKTETFICCCLTKRDQAKLSGSKSESSTSGRGKPGSITSNGWIEN